MTTISARVTPAILTLNMKMGFRNPKLNFVSEKFSEFTLPKFSAFFPFLIFCLSYRHIHDERLPIFFDRVERIFREINNSIIEGSLVITLSLKKLPVVLSRLTALTGLLVIRLTTTFIVITLDS